MTRILGLILSILPVFTAIAQTGPDLFLDNRPPVIINGNTLSMPWTGGLNSPIFNEIDLNADGINDLMVFDRVGYRYSTYINKGIAGAADYTYDPFYTSLFPAVRDWVRTADYDCDGDMDLFIYNNGVMAVYRNDPGPGYPLFVLVINSLDSDYGPFSAPIFVSPVNMPALTDVDGDGDLDVLTFSNSSNFIEYHMNYAMDSTGSCGSFNFYLQPYCWGYFKLSGLTNIGILNQNCRSGAINDDDAERNRHSGSVLTPLDQGCDGDIDLFNGDILGENMLFLENGGNPDSAIITSQDTAFPVYDVPVDMQNLPAAYYMDVDNDGNKDLIVSPYATVGEDFTNVWLYRNTTDNCTNTFDFIKNRFLADQMIDVGTASNVAFYDVDADGLMDIIAGNDIYYNSNPNLSVSRLAYFRNTGTATQPGFTLISDDWLNLSSLSQYGLFPAFGDLDNDNDSDMLLGNANGTLIYYMNTAGAGNPSSFTLSSVQYQGIDIGNNSTPQIIDVNRDGKNDLIVGERSGILNYFENIGTASVPVFTNWVANFGGVNVLGPLSIAGYSQPLLFDDAGSYKLLVGSESGTIFFYENIDGNLSGTFTLADSSYQDIFEPKRITITRADIDGDGKTDLLAGCNSGGMRLYTQYTSIGSVETDYQGNEKFDIFPNPGRYNITLRLQPSRAANRLITISDPCGRVIQEFNAYSNEVQLDISTLNSGIYFISVNNGPYRNVQKFIKN